MVDYSLFESLLSQDFTGYIEDGDYIDYRTMEMFSFYKEVDVRKLFKQSQNNETPHFFVEVKCRECGKFFVKEMSKTSLLEAVRVVKHEREGVTPRRGLLGYTCEECLAIYKEEEERKKEENRIHDEEYRDKCTEDYINKYLNPDNAWKNNVKNWTKIQELQRTYARRNRIIDYIKNMSYGDFLETPYWKAISERIRYRAQNKCQLCGSDKYLNVHHRSYENHGDEINHMEDLICLCKDCHQNFHNV